MIFKLLTDFAVPSVASICFYAPNFEEVWEAYWFGPVRPSLCYTCTRSRTVRDRILKFGM